MKNSIQPKQLFSGRTIAQCNDALAALDAAARHITDPHLRQFFNAVTKEPEIHLALTTPLTGAQRAETGYGHVEATDLYPIQVIGRAARIAGLWCTQRPLVHDVLYVATIAQGLRPLLQEYVSAGSDLDDVLFTLIRPALHRLDDRHADAARLLRNVLNLGNGDEVLDSDVLQMRHAAINACQLVHRKRGARRPTRKPLTRSRFKDGQSQYLQCNTARPPLACGGCDWEKAL